MGKSTKTQKDDILIHKCSAAKLESREARRSQVEHERRTRTCTCPPWETHSAKCPINLLLSDDNPNLNPFEVIRRRKEAKKESFVEGTGVKEEVLVGTVSAGSNTTIGIDQADKPTTG